VHSRVPTVGTMLMCVIRMMPLGAGGHGFAHLSWVFSGRASQCRLPFEELAFRVISARALLSACLSLPIRPVCSERDIPDVVTGCRCLTLLKFSPDDLAAAWCNGQTDTSDSCSLPIDQCLPSPRPSGGSLVIIGPGIGLPGPIAFSGGLVER
jgi:hypothetical protein